MHAEGNISVTYQGASGCKMGGQHGEQEAIDAVRLPSKALGSGPHLHNRVSVAQDIGCGLTITRSGSQV